MRACCPRLQAGRAHWELTTDTRPHTLARLFRILHALELGEPASLRHELSRGEAVEGAAAAPEGDPAGGSLLWPPRSLAAELSLLRMLRGGAVARAAQLELETPQAFGMAMRAHHAASLMELAKGEAESLRALARAVEVEWVRLLTGGELPPRLLL